MQDFKPDTYFFLLIGKKKSKKYLKKAIVKDDWRVTQDVWNVIVGFPIVILLGFALAWFYFLWV